MAKTKNKKKIGIAAVALAMILAASATAGVTLARYVSEGSVEKSTATVAKWGYTLTADASALFGQAYEKGGTVTTEKDGTIVVSTTTDVDGTTKKVVAPGTKGEFTLSLNGQSETNAVLTINVTKFQEIWLTYYYGHVTYPGGQYVDDNYSYIYHPIAWEVNGHLVERPVDSQILQAYQLEEISERKKLILSQRPDIGFGATQLTAITEDVFANAIAGAIEEFDLEAEVEGSLVTVKIPAQTQLKDFKLTISWDWAEHTEATGGYNSEYDPNMCDKWDTMLGEYASGIALPNNDGFNADGTLIIYDHYGGEKTAGFGLTATLEQTLDSFKD